MKTNWLVQHTDRKDTERLCEVLGCPHAVAAVLIHRGLGDPEKALNFLAPSFHHMRSPFNMKDMDKAVIRIVEAIRKKQKILVFGDYDVDGITATALLVDFFTSLNAHVAFHVPDRITEGYGLTVQAVEQYAIGRNVDLIITVDCGISSHSAVALAATAGIDVIITDHHEVPETTPDAFAVIDPKRRDCRSGFTWLAGVGVAFNLVLALRKHLRDAGYWNGTGEPNLKTFCDLVALGTVADMVPLLEENRVFVNGGLEVLSQCPRPGLKAVLELSGATNGFLDTWDLAFRLAPRINAAGRMGNASAGCELLMTSDPQRALEIAHVLEGHNTRRKEIENQIFNDIVAYLESHPHDMQDAVVMNDPQWHEGVVGIVASRLVSRFFRPVVLIAEREDGTGKGSARSPAGFDLYKALSVCADHLDRFGGHEAAAGLSISVAKIPAFKKAFEQTAAQKMSPEIRCPKLSIDATLSSEDLSPIFLDNLEKLAPFGIGNPEPMFLMSDMTVVSCRSVGNGHLRLELTQNGLRKGQPLEAIFFNAPFRDTPPRDFRHVVCRIRWNRWKGNKRLQLVIKDFEPHK